VQAGQGTVFAVLQGTFVALEALQRLQSM